MLQTAWSVIKALTLANTDMQTSTLLLSWALHYVSFFVVIHVVAKNVTPKLAFAC